MMAGLLRIPGRLASGIGLEMRGELGDNAAPMHGKLLKSLTAVVVVLALAFPFLLALEKISESDTFWHLKTGEWIIAHGAIPHVDPFSATVNGKQWNGSVRNDPLAGFQ